MDSPTDPGHATPWRPPGALDLPPPLVPQLRELVKDRRRWERLVPLLREHGTALLQQGYTDVLQSCLWRIPAPFQRGQADLSLLCAKWLEWEGSWPEALGCYHQAWRVAQQGSDTGLYAAVLGHAGLAQDRFGGSEESREALLLEARPLLAHGDGKVVADILSLQGIHYSSQGIHLALAYEDLERAYRRAQGTGDLATRALAAIRFGLVRGMAGDFGSAIAILSEAEHLCRQGHAHGWAAHLKLNQAMLFVIEGSTSAAEAMLDSLDKGCPRPAYVVRAACLTRAMLALSQGRGRSGRSLLRRLESAPVARQHEPWYWAVDVGISLLVHDLKRADRVHRKLDALVRSPGPRGFFFPYCALASSRFWQSMDRPVEAWGAAQRALEVACSGRMPFWEMQACRLLAALDPERGRRYLEKAEQIAQAHAFGLSEASDARPTRMAEIWTPGLDVRGVRADEPAVDVRVPSVRCEPTLAIHIQTLGGFSMAIGGKPTPPSVLGRREILRLLKLMVSGPELSREKSDLAHSLWPKRCSRACQNNLTRNIQELRHLLLGLGAPPDLLTSVGESYHLSGPHLRVDWLEFDRLAHEADAHRQQGRLDDALCTYGIAVDLYRGAFLPQETLRSIQDRRRALRDRYVACLGWLGELTCQRQDYRCAVDWFVQALTHDPTQEAWLSKLLEACYVSRTLAHAKTARRQYGLFMRRLRNTRRRGGSLAIRRQFDRQF